MADLSVRQTRLAHALTGRDFLSLMRVVKGFVREYASEWDIDGTVESVSLDSRFAGPGAVFVALAGERVDGHSFIPQVVAAGCRVCMVSRSWADSRVDALEDWSAGSGVLFLVYADVLAALQDWAGMYLRSLGNLVRVGITGSNGKTTTKELIAGILGQEYVVFASPGNMNSVLGLPLAVLSIPESAQIGVFEMAMSEAGEMTSLARMIQPGYAVITNIGRAHIGNLGSQQGIAAEKKQIFSCMGTGDLAFVPAADPYAGFLEEGLLARVCPYGEAVNPGYEGWEAAPEGQVIRWNGRRIVVRLGGEHHRADVLAAIRVAETLGVSADAICRGLESFVPQTGRGQVLDTGSWIVVNDCYNANPDSMAASMKAFMEMPCRGRRIMVLGDMGELGQESGRSHEEIGRLAAALAPDTVFFVGTSMTVAYSAALKAHSALDARHFVKKTDAASVLGGYVQKGDLILVKASRSMELESLFPVLGIGEPEPVAAAGGCGSC